MKPPESGEVEWFDTAKGSAPGFGLRVFPSGTKSFAITYRRNGRKRRFSLGKYPIVSLAEARARAKQIEASKADPSAERAHLQQIASFRATAAAFLDENDPRFRPSTFTEYKRIVESVLVPEFGALRLDQIARSDVKVFLKGIAKDRPHMANRVHAVARQIFNFAVSEERIAASPIAGLEKPAFAGKRGEPRRDRVLDQDEIRAIWTALDTERPLIANYFRLLFLTGCRKRETLDAEWAQIDTNQRLWRIPAESTKTGKPHDVPLSPAALAALDAVHALTGHSDYVFVSYTGRAILNPNKAKARIQKESGVSFRIHDIRRSVATHLARIGIRSETVSAILGHAVGASAATRIYERYERLPEKRAALERWAGELGAIVSGDAQTARVLTFGSPGARDDTDASG